jgi:hypothetical protein
LTLSISFDNLPLVTDLSMPRRPRIRLRWSIGGLLFASAVIKRY